MRLFTDRVRAARPGFGLDDANRAAVGELRRRLDGIPLAIELAAARVSAMSPGDIANLLDERFRLLTVERRTAVERHQTLRATVDCSCSLLGEVERSVFDRPGVFAGSFDASAASAVAFLDGVERWDVLDALVSLVAKSMVVAEEAEHGGTRYQLLETLRQYARERLDDADTADEVRRRHATHYCEHAEELGPRLHGPDEIAARRRVRADLDELCAAVFWAADAQAHADADLAVRIVAALATEAIQDQQTGLGSWAVRIADLAARSSPGRRMAALGAAASQAVTLGDYAGARRYADACSAPYFPYCALQEVEAYGGRPAEAYRLAVQARETLEASGAHAYSVAMEYGLAAVWAISAGDLGPPAARCSRSPASTSSGCARWRCRPTQRRPRRWRLPSRRNSSRSGRPRHAPTATDRASSELCWSRPRCSPPPVQKPRA
jgi:hypothetical protein